MLVFGSSSHTEAGKAQTKPSSKRKSIYWDHFKDIISPTTRKLRRRNANIARTYYLSILMIGLLL